MYCFSLYDDGVIIWKFPGAEGEIEKEINNFQQVIFPTSSALVTQISKTTVSLLNYFT